MLGMEIKIARIKKGIKGYLFAQMLGISPDILSKIENNRIIPNEKLLARIKILLDIDK